jgi:gamma-glutamylcyclotransferase (GGCT)/AIG2-like uncharacterized protein YtfP
MPLYFAYGANLDVAAMARRCPRSRALGQGRLARHRVAIMKEGYATVVPDPSAMVHGLLFDLAFADVPALDRYEEVGVGLYQKIIQPVLRAEGGSVRALIYVGRGGEARGVSPAPGYLESVIAAATSVGLPAEHIAYLRSLAPGAAMALAPVQGGRAIKYAGKPLWAEDAP